jgi:hypothetical protein
MQPITRNQLRESHPIELEKRRIQQIRINEAYAKMRRDQDLIDIKNWIQLYIYEPIKRAAKDGVLGYQFQMNEYPKNQEYHEHIMTQINTLFPDCDVKIHPGSLPNSDICSIRWE